MKIIGMNVGFITNSSSVVYHFPKEVLEHKSVKHLIESYNIGNGYIGSDMWHRGQCESIATTKETKKALKDQMKSDYLSLGYGDEYYGPQIDDEDDSIVIVYGDEYDGLAQELCYAMEEACEELGITGSRDDYN